MAKEQGVSAISNKRLLRFLEKHIRHLRMFGANPDNAMFPGREVEVIWPMMGGFQTKPPISSKEKSKKR